MVERQLVTVGRKTKGWWPSGDQHSRHWQARDTHGAKAIKWDFCKKQDISIISARAWEIFAGFNREQHGDLTLKNQSRHGVQVLCWWGWSDTWGAHWPPPGSQPWDGYVKGSGKTPDSIREFWGAKDPLPLPFINVKREKETKDSLRPKELETEGQLNEACDSGSWARKIKGTLLEIWCSESGTCELVGSFFPRLTSWFGGFCVANVWWFPCLFSKYILEFCIGC